MHIQPGLMRNYSLSPRKMFYCYTNGIAFQSDTYFFCVWETISIEPGFGSTIKMPIEHFKQCSIVWEISISYHLCELFLRHGTRIMIFSHFLQLVYIVRVLIINNRFISSFQVCCWKMSEHYNMRKETCYFILGKLYNIPKVLLRGFST